MGYSNAPCGTRQSERTRCGLDSAGANGSNAGMDQSTNGEVCDAALRKQLLSRLTEFETHRREASDIEPPDPARELRAAAVALVVVDAGHGSALPGMPAFDDWQPAPALVLTQRSSKLNNHPGQWALPGGRIDHGETTVDAALRELREEVAVHCEPGAVLGRLDDFVTRSGFVMSPVVVWAGARVALEGDPREVAGVHRVPFSELRRDDAPQLDPIEDSEAPVLRMPLGSTWVAAPTAAIIYQFREVCLFGRSTRVAHYEQPHFARR